MPVFEPPDCDLSILNFTAFLGLVDAANEEVENTKSFFSLAVEKRRLDSAAAHVVFDDGTLSAATGVQWVFQRERGTYEPVPQIPRGSYILSGYSAQRIADSTPGTSSVAAHNLDVASVWFYEQDAGRGGSGGYLASDSTDNEWLISPRLKTIVGYPLDGIAAANQRRIHATTPISATFGHANARV